MSSEAPAIPDCQMCTSSLNLLDLRMEIRSKAERKSWTGRCRPNPRSCCSNLLWDGY
ncbi:hypothetical protein DPMN_039173 [Dreissena polymorpha]|uniref:Uncharacterized protein n=1 Tax=Dreissena polymorpha TaxID=45954 RepID=A0A9D4MIE3_DREPO|nr:hypothetical protein DPMN_039173 [Dreissena polymorpha]